jgi:hypothetical protein
VHVSPVSILSAVLRHHIQSKPELSKLNSQAPSLQALIAELEAAPTAAEKLVILERVLASEIPKSSSALPDSVQEPQVNKDSEPVWRISSKSAESLNNLQAERHGRQWEVEAAIRAIFENARFSAADQPQPDLAVPFRPSASDMERAIEALGYSARLLFPDELKAERFGDDVGTRTAISMRWLVMCVLLLAAVLVAVWV